MIYSISHAKHKKLKENDNRLARISFPWYKILDRFLAHCPWRTLTQSLYIHRANVYDYLIIVHNFIKWKPGLGCPLIENNNQGMPNLQDFLTTQSMRWRVLLSLFKIIIFIFSAHGRSPRTFSYFLATLLARCIKSN